MNKIGKNELKLIILAIAVFIFGVLFCCATKTAVNVLSVIIGIIFILSGALLIVESILVKKSSFTSDSASGAFALAFGILFIAKELGWLILEYIPYILIVLGVIILIDAILIMAIKQRKNIFAFTYELILGIVALVLGILLLTSDDFREYASLVFGITLIVYAVFILLVALFAKNVVVVVKVDSDTIDAESTELNE